MTTPLINRTYCPIQQMVSPSGLLVNERRAGLAALTSTKGGGLNVEERVGETGYSDGGSAGFVGMTAIDFVGSSGSRMTRRQARVGIRGIARHCGHDHRLVGWGERRRIGDL